MLPKLLIFSISLT